MFSRAIQPTLKREKKKEEEERKEKKTYDL
jgi:hypothetical protein